MVSVSDLPDIDDPGSVRAVGEDIKDIGHSTLAIVINAEDSWTAIKDAYHDPQEHTVHNGMDKPRIAAEELKEESDSLGDVLQNYASELEDFHRRKDQLAGEIEAALAELDAAKAMPETVTEDDPANPDETREVPNKEREQAISAAEEKLARLAVEVANLKRDVENADSNTASAFVRGSIGQHSLLKFSEGLLNGRFAQGVVDGLLPLLGLLAMGSLSAFPPLALARNTSMAFSQALTLREFFKSGGLENSLRSFTELTADYAASPRGHSSIERHGKAWLQGEIIEVMNDPAYSLGNATTYLLPGWAGVLGKTAKGANATGKVLERGARSASRGTAAGAAGAGVHGALSDKQRSAHGGLTEENVSATEFFDGQGRQELIDQAHAQGDSERAAYLAGLNPDQIGDEYRAMAYGGGDTDVYRGFNNPFAISPHEEWNGVVDYQVNTGEYTGETDFPEELPDRVERARGEAPDPKTTVVDYVNDGVREVRVEIGQNTTIYRIKSHYIEVESQVGEKFTKVPRDDQNAAKAHMSNVGKTPGDHAGHLQAHMFGPNSGIGNFRPQDGNLNSGAYKNGEELVMKGVEGHDSVGYTETDVYLTPTGRPSEYDFDIELRDRASDASWLDADLDFKNNANQEFYPDPKKYSEEWDQPDLTAGNFGNVKQEGMENGPVKVSNPPRP